MAPQSGPLTSDQILGMWECCVTAGLSPAGRHSDPIGVRAFGTRQVKGSDEGCVLTEDRAYRSDCRLIENCQIFKGKISPLCVLPVNRKWMPHYFNNRLITQIIRKPSSLWVQLCMCEYFLLFSILCHGKLNIFYGFGRFFRHLNTLQCAF